MSSELLWSDKRFLDSSTSVDNLVSASIWSGTCKDALVSHVNVHMAKDSIILDLDMARALSKFLNNYLSTYENLVVSSKEE